MHVQRRTCFHDSAEDYVPTATDVACRWYQLSCESHLRPACLIHVLGGDAECESKRICGASLGLRLETSHFTILIPCVKQKQLCKYNIIT